MRKIISFHISGIRTQYLVIKSSRQLSKTSPGIELGKAAGAFPNNNKM
jgi:hypothetical protein